jgi:hypothetical protein
MASFGTAGLKQGKKLAAAAAQQQAQREACITYQDSLELVCRFSTAASDLSFLRRRLTYISLQVKCLLRVVSSTAPTSSVCQSIDKHMGRTWACSCLSNVESCSYENGPIPLRMASVILQWTWHHSCCAAFIQITHAQDCKGWTGASKCLLEVLMQFVLNAVCVPCQLPPRHLPR